jgi:hypothetical protein
METAKQQEKQAILWTKQSIEKSRKTPVKSY